MKEGGGATNPNYAREFSAPRRRAGPQNKGKVSLNTKRKNHGSKGGGGFNSEFPKQPVERLSTI